MDEVQNGDADRLSHRASSSAYRAAWTRLRKSSAPRRRRPSDEIVTKFAPSYSDQPYPFRDIHDNLRRLYDAFGPARWFWGTDITRMPCPWRQCVTLFTDELPWLKGRDLELVMGRAVCDWLGWKR